MQESGLAMAIGIASLLLLVIPIVFFSWLFSRFFKRRAVGGVLGAAFGAGLGVLIVLATFFESTWSPPPTMTIEVPAGFKHEWVFLIAEPASQTTIVWKGVDAPFMSASTRLVVPMSGVLRVNDLGRVDGDDVRATLSTGKTMWGKAALNLGERRVVAYNFAQYPGNEADPVLLDAVAFAAFLKAREAEEK